VVGEDTPREPEANQTVLGSGLQGRIAQHLPGGDFVDDDRHANDKRCDDHGYLGIDSQ
jgi:hypothetical protein